MRACAVVSGLSAIVAIGALATGCVGPGLRPAAPPEGLAEEQGSSPPAAPPAAATPPAPSESAVSSGVPPEGTDVEPGAGGTNPAGDQRDPHRVRRYWGLAILSVGVEAAIVAGVTSILILHQKSIRDDGCNAQKVCDEDGKNAASTIDTIVPWNTASWIVGAVGVTAGLVLVLTSQPKAGPETMLTVSPALAGASIGIRSTF